VIICRAWGDFANSNSSELGPPCDVGLVRAARTTTRASMSRMSHQIRSGEQRRELIQQPAQIHPTNGLVKPTGCQRGIFSTQVGTDANSLPALICINS